MNEQPTLFEGQRMTLTRSIELTTESLRVYGERYAHWAIAYSGGKDSTCVATLVPQLITNGTVPRPKSLTVLYADTRLELPPLRNSAEAVMAELRRRGIECRVVYPRMEDRFFVYMLGRGVPPPSNTFRWCTSQIKIEPMIEAGVWPNGWTGTEERADAIFEEIQRDGSVQESFLRDLLKGGVVR